MRTSLRGLTAAALPVLLSAYLLNVGPDDPARSDHTPQDAGAATASTRAAGATSQTRGTSGAADAVDKILVLVVENHSLEQMRSGMPFTAGLADRYGHAVNYHAITHPSLPNYLAIAGGTTGGVTDDAPPAANPLAGQTVFGQALEHGRTARVYADGMQGSCTLQNGGSGYAVRHNPWAYYPAERRACQSYDVPLTSLRRDIADGRLPNVGMVIPNVCHDAHDCSLASADAWFRQQLTALMNGPDWASGHLAIVVTADEDDWNHGNQVLTTVISPGVRSLVVRSPLTHYSLSRALSEVAGGRPLQRAAGAPSLLRAFGLHAGAA